MNELRKEYHNKTAGQIGEKARDLQTSYFTDEYVFWLEEQLKQLRIASVVVPKGTCCLNAERISHVTTGGESYSTCGECGEKIV